tara:strand:+ start:279 stop:764 length:486 start_codon:yes stop_codon:yes gene_type:complete
MNEIELIDNDIYIRWNKYSEKLVYYLNMLEEFIKINYKIDDDNNKLINNENKLKKYENIYIMEHIISNYSEYIMKLINDIKYEIYNINSIIYYNNLSGIILNNNIDSLVKEIEEDYIYINDLIKKKFRIIRWDVEINKEEIDKTENKFQMQLDKILNIHNI